jgi:hypothetical protein
MNKIILVLLLFLNSTIGISQDTPTKKKKVSFRRQLNASTKEQINQLKDGALLVRLKTKNLTITALRNADRNKQADAIEKKQAEFNLNIISAFRANFNFCPVYFFYSDYSSNVKERKFDSVMFLNDSLRPDTTIKFTGKTFLVAEFGTIEQDTAKNFSHYSYEPNTDWTLKEVSHYYGSTDFGFEALIIRSDQFVQLRHPFPYYTRTFDPMPRKQVLNKAVRRMNRKLTSFYKQKNK